MVSHQLPLVSGATWNDPATKEGVACVGGMVTGRGCLKGKVNSGPCVLDDQPSGLWGQPPSRAAGPRRWKPAPDRLLRWRDEGCAAADGPHRLIRDPVWPQLPLLPDGQLILIRSYFQCAFVLQTSSEHPLRGRRKRSRRIMSTLKETWKKLRSQTGQRSSEREEERGEEEGGET